MRSDVDFFFQRRGMLMLDTTSSKMPASGATRTPVTKSRLPTAPLVRGFTLAALALQANAHAELFEAYKRINLRDAFAKLIHARKRAARTSEGALWGLVPVEAERAARRPARAFYLLRARQAGALCAGLPLRTEGRVMLLFQSRWLVCVFALMMLALHAAAQSALFEGNPLIDPGLGGTFRSTLGDLDGDGHDDLVVTGYEPGRIAVYRNTRGGPFGPRTTLHVAPGLNVCSLGDLDRDGDAELVVISDRSKLVQIFENDGHGNFGAPLSLATSAQPSEVVLGDVDQDQNVDLVIGSGTSPYVQVCRNRGDGTFAMSEPFLAPVYVRVLALGDLDQDGDLDLALGGTEGQGADVMRNDGNGAFVPWFRLSAHGECAVAIDDLNGDGWLDVLVVVTTPFHDLRTFLSLGGGTFAPPITTWTAGFYPTGLALVDLEGDGDRDVVVSSASNRVWLLTNSGTGHLDPVRWYATQSAPQWVEARDVDRDGDPDVLATSIGGVGVLLQSHTGTFHTPGVSVEAASQVLVEDLDGDLDLDWIALRESVVAILRNDNGVLSVVQQHPMSYYAGELQLADLDQDGDLDLLASGGFGTHIMTLLNQGGCSFAPPVSAVPGVWTSSFTTADFDGDLDIHLVVTSFAQADIRLFLNQGNGTFGAGLGVAAGTEPDNVQAADLDGDGDVDLALTNSQDSVCVLMNQGTGTFAAPVVYPLGASVLALAASDLDGDGDVDLALIPDDASLMTVVNSGNGTFTPSWRGGPRVGEPSSLRLVDVNADRRPDAVLGCYQGMAVFVNSGDNTFVEAASYLMGHGLGAPAVRDIDSDGDNDVVISDNWYSEVAVLRNTTLNGIALCAGDGTATPCPCGNDSAVGARAGCLNSLGSGATLRGSGSATLTSDTSVLGAEHMPDSLALYFQGTSAVQGGAGQPFGDGLRCVGGALVRIGVRTNVNGASRYPGANDASLSAVAAIAAPGQRLYQVIYRNAASFCTPATFNSSNAWRITWLP